MASLVFTLLGGLGLFLLGMAVLTDGLRALAGGRLRLLLRRTTSTAFSGAVTGMVATALLQSSSATTVASVGFVNAGLMTFTQALGIIFGANIGTTVTGWLVAILGFKLQIGSAVMPLLFAGVLCRLFARGWLRHAGWALAGFSLLFFGIEALQQGMQSLRTFVSPEIFPDDTLFGRLQLVLIGMAITIVTQSSSAGVATALTALGAGAISLPQAAAMVIGMDVGTTFTAALATLGGSVASRRTGYAHVIYNVMTGVMAFFLLPFLIGATQSFTLLADPQLALVAFHSAFNVIGVVAILGVTGRFARLIVFLVPDRGPRLTARLDDRFLREPEAAIDALQATVSDLSDALFDSLRERLGAFPPADLGDRLDAIRDAEEQTRRFAERVRTDPADRRLQARHQATIHALDHVERLYQRGRQDDRIDLIAGDPDLETLAADLSGHLKHPDPGQTERDRVVAADALRKRFRTARGAFRERAIADATAGRIETAEVLQKLDSVRWLHRVAYHVWRIRHHRLDMQSGETEPATESEAALETHDD